MLCYARETMNYQNNFIDPVRQISIRTKILLIKANKNIKKKIMALD